MAHEGKSSIAFRLAKSMASLEKRVLYLDGDIRNSTTQVRYNILGDKEGLSEYLCGEAAKEKIIYHTDDPWLDMIFTGAKAPNPSALVSGPLFQELMQFLKSVYDYVIVDTKPTIEAVKEVLKEMNVEDVTNVETKSGEKVDLTEYKFTTPFIDIAEQIGDQITYKTNGDLEVKVKIDAAKEKKAEDLLLMLVDPETGKVVFITIDEIDPVTGELKVTLPFLGAITLLDKSAVDENEIETQTTDAGAADTETAAE